MTTLFENSFVKNSELKLKYIEEAHIKDVLNNYADGNKVLAALILGIDRRTLYRRLEQMKKEENESKNSD